MKAPQVLVAVGLMLGSFSFCEAQNVSESLKPATQQKVETTDALKARVLRGTVKANSKKVQFLTTEQADALVQKRAAEFKGKNIRREAEGVTPTTK